jgi:hypothetical protein
MLFDNIMLPRPPPLLVWLCSFAWSSLLVFSSLFLKLLAIGEKMKIKRWLFIAFAPLFFSAAANAEWERTVCTWDTRLPEKGKLQPSFWGGYWTSKSAGTELKQYAGALDITYGIRDNWSICFEPNLYRWEFAGGDSEAGIADTRLMTTYRFLDEPKSYLDLAIMALVSLPTGDEERHLGSGRFEPGLKLLASKTFGSIIAAANLGGYTIIDSRDDEKDFAFLSSLESIYPLNDRLSLNASISFWTARSDGSDDASDVGFGTRFNLPKRMFLAGMIYKCLTNDYDQSLTTALGFEF